MVIRNMKIAAESSATRLFANAELTIRYYTDTFIDVYGIADKSWYSSP